MLGFFGVFGRSRELRRFDQALRARGLHPRLVPEAVKLAALRLLTDTEGDANPGGIERTAEVLAYCMLGAGAFAEENGSDRTAAIERRLEAAVEVGDSLDARLVLLAMHAGVIAPSVIARYELEAG